MDGKRQTEVYILPPTVRLRSPQRIKSSMRLRDANGEKHGTNTRSTTGLDLGCERGHVSDRDSTIDSIPEMFQAS